jgi:hypothetical protein
MTCDFEPRASSAMKLLAHSGMWCFQPKSKAKVRRQKLKELGSPHYEQRQQAQPSFLEYLIASSQNTWSVQ